METLCLLIGKESVLCMDGDILEEKNLNRLIFSRSDLGRNKAQVMGERYGCEWLAEWFSYGVRSYDEHDWLIGEVDNHPARAAMLDTCDLNKCRAIFAGNETYSSEAYVYLPEWKDTRLDPRVYYPEILSDTSGDPRRAGIGCTGEQQVKNPQLATSNLMGTALLCHLFVIHAMESRKLPKEAHKHLPHRLFCTFSRMGYSTIGVPSENDEPCR